MGCHEQHGSQWQAAVTLSAAPITPKTFDPSEHCLPPPLSVACAPAVPRCSLGATGLSLEQAVVKRLEWFPSSCLRPRAGKYMLAHAASAQGISAVENMCGRAHELNHLSVPAACFTHPEVSFVGLTEEAAREAAAAGGFSSQVAVVKTSFKANSKACPGSRDGAVLRALGLAEAALAVHKQQQRISPQRPAASTAGRHRLRRPPTLCCCDSGVGLRQLRQRWPDSRSSGMHEAERRA